MSRQKLSGLFLANAILLLALSAATLVPFSSSMISDLGYYTLCPFAPWTTLALRRHINAQSE